MRIIKVLSKKVKGVEYNKYIINLPKKIVENSELLDKDLKATAGKAKITIGLE